MDVVICSLLTRNLLEISTMHLFVFFTILQALSTSLSQEAGPTNFVSQHNHGLSKDFKPDLNIHSLQNKEKLTKKISHLKEKIDNQSNINRTNEIKEYLDHIKERGVNALKYLGQRINKELNTVTNVNEKVNAVSNDYVTKLQSYFEYIEGNKTTGILNEDIVFLDIAEIACRLIYREEINILKEARIALNMTKEEDKDYTYSMENTDVAVKANSTTKLLNNTVQTLNDSIHRNCMNIRKEEMQLVCDKYKVCRPYPAFTDYCGYFVSEMLKLPDKKFTIFARLLPMVVRVNEHFVSMMSDFKVNHLDSTDVEKFSSNITKIKESLDLLRKYLTQKFNIVHSEHFKQEITAPALRNLLDIIDNSFQHEYRDNFVTNFENTITSIRSWVKDKIPTIASVIQHFINSILTTFAKILQSDKNLVKKIEILIEMMMHGGNMTQHLKKYIQEPSASGLDHLNFV